MGGREAEVVRARRAEALQRIGLGAVDDVAVEEVALVPVALVEDRCEMRIAATWSTSGTFRIARHWCLS